MRPALLRSPSRRLVGRTPSLTWVALAPLRWAELIGLANSNKQVGVKGLVALGLGISKWISIAAFRPLGFREWGLGYGNLRFTFSRIGFKAKD